MYLYEAGILHVVFHDTQNFCYGLKRGTTYGGYSCPPRIFVYNNSTVIFTGVQPNPG
jgi:hypothetical protein